MKNNSELARSFDVVLVEFRCGEQHRGRACGAFVGRYGWNRDDGGGPSGAELRVLTPVKLGHQHVERGRDAEGTVRTYRTAWADLRDDGEQVPDYVDAHSSSHMEFYRGDDTWDRTSVAGVFRLPGYRRPPNQRVMPAPMPAEVKACCSRGRHPDVVVLRDELVRRIAEYRTTHRRVVVLVSRHS